MASTLVVLSSPQISRLAKWQVRQLVGKDKNKLSHKYGIDWVHGGKHQNKSSKLVLYLARSGLINTTDKRKVSSQRKITERVEQHGICYPTSHFPIWYRRRLNDHPFLVDSFYNIAINKSMICFWVFEWSFMFLLFENKNHFFNDWKSYNPWVNESPSFYRKLPPF